MKRILVVFAALLLSANAFADTMNVGGSTSWNSWTASQVSNGPFWAGSSYDGNGECNIGHYVGGVSGCNYSEFYQGSPNSLSPYLGQGMSTISFTPTGAVSSVTFKMGVSAWTSEFGWYNTNNESVLYPLLNKNVSSGSTYTFTPGSDYGLYLKTKAGTWLSTHTYDGVSHFALFNIGDGYLFGIEDSSSQYSADWDYQDFAGVIPSTPVPEPGTMVLFSIGSALFGVTRLRRRR